MNSSLDAIVQLKAEKRGAIIDALGMCSCARDADKLGQVCKRLSYSQELRLGGTLEDVIESLVKHATRSRRRLCEFLDRAREFGGGPVSAALLDTLQTVFTPLAVPWRDLENLKRLLHEHDLFEEDGDEFVEDLGRAVVISANDVSLDLHDAKAKGELFSRSLDVLADLPVMKPDKAPLLEFLELFRRHLEPVKMDLAVWENNIAKKLDVELAQVCDRAQRRWKDGSGGTSPEVSSDGPLKTANRPLTLQVFFDRQQVGESPAEFYISAHFEQDHTIPIKDANAGPLLKQEVKAKFSGIMCSVGKDRRVTRLEAVELFLPLDLLEIDFDMVAIASGLRGRQTPIGQKWPVIVRSGERLDDVQGYWDARLRWEEKWRRLHQNGWSHELGVWASDCQAPQELEKMLLQNTRLSCQAILTSPDASPVGNLETIFDMAFSGGIPLGLWLRNHNGDVMATRETIAAFWPTEASNWPKRIRDYRLGSTAACPCDGISLLYDDPFRAPPRGNSALFQGKLDAEL